MPNPHRSIAATISIIALMLLLLFQVPNTTSVTLVAAMGMAGG